MPLIGSVRRNNGISQCCRCQFVQIGNAISARPKEIAKQRLAVLGGPDNHTAAIAAGSKRDGKPVAFFMR